MSDANWADIVDRLKKMTNIPAALAEADLLASAQARWDGVVVPHTSLSDLLFALPGDRFPFAVSVRVSWQDGVFEFQLTRQELLITADRCREPSRLVLDSFLSQLAGGSSPI
jgi:hypothetical protein